MAERRILYFQLEDKEHREKLLYYTFKSESYMLTIYIVFQVQKKTFINILKWRLCLSAPPSRLRKGIFMCKVLQEEKVEDGTGKRQY